MAYERTQARRIAQGQCKDCGEDRGELGTTVFCRPCADQHSKRASLRRQEQRRKWAEAGENTCNQCGAVLESTQFKLCETCRARARTSFHATAKQKRLSKLGTGVCVGCSRATIPQSNYCKKHWIEGLLRKYGFCASEYDMVWNKLVEQDFRCYYTGIELVPGINCSLDHRVPRSRGGALKDIDNVVWCDRLINAFKNDLTETEFVSRCQLVVDHVASRPVN